MSNTLCHNRESKDLWNIYTEEYFLFMIVTTLNIQALSVQEHNHASLLGDQLVAAAEMYVWSYLPLLVVLEDFPNHFASLIQGMGTVDPRFGAFRSSARILQSPGRLPPKAPHTNCMNIICTAPCFFFYLGCIALLNAIAIPIHNCPSYLMQMADGLEAEIMVAKGMIPWWIDVSRLNLALQRISWSC